MNTFPHPLVSLIVTTKNNHATLDACLHSLAEQDYPHKELIIVDNNSSDDTREIATRYTPQVFKQGPERSAQRNFGVQQARGDYIMIIDSDMEVSSSVVSSCVAKIQEDPNTKAIIIPEESFGQGFWAQCKKLERSFYIGVDAIEAARFFDKQTYEAVGGYNEVLTGGEDWDLTNRIRQQAHIGRIQPYIFHNEGHPRFTHTINKMYYYAQHAIQYFNANPTQSALTGQSGPLARYKLFFSKPGRLLRNPFIGVGMLLLKTAEYAAAGFGLLQAKRTSRKSPDREPA